MFSSLPVHPEDKILKIAGMFREDPRSDKIDLGIGVYKDAMGLTPIMRAVKTAEKQLWDTEDSKTYVGLVGAGDFNDAMVALVLKDAVQRDHVAAAATPGGTGAVRQGFEMIQMASPDATVWVSNPSWGNHASILDYLRIPNRYYRYFEASTGELNFDGMLEDLNSAKAGDVVLLHGCCHNPTGVNLDQEQWETVTSLVNERGLTPMIDLAYQGFGDGLDEDTAGVRHVAANSPETIIAASCSKNFGIYRERTGALLSVANSDSDIGVVQANLAFLNRQNFSFPPDHGARLVTMVLNDDSLRADWEDELHGIRDGVLGLRQQLVAAFREATGGNHFDFLGRHRGMFSMLGLSEEQVARLRDDHGIYAVSDSRINVAGLNEKTVPILAKAVNDVMTTG